MLPWALAAVPLVGAIELVLHVKQTTVDVVSLEDYRAAADAVKAEAKPDDLVVFAPFWADPLGREAFGDALAGMKHEARPDETRFPRAFEVSIRGARAKELEGWKTVWSKDVGKVHVTLLENPAPAKILVDLVDLVTPERLRVARVEGGAETPCPFQRGVGQPGGLGVPQGPAVPAAKFVCASGFVGVAVLHDLEHRPRLCIFASPQGASASLRLAFSDVPFGASVHGHTGVQWLTERTPSQERFEVSFEADGRPIGTAVHRVGVGWNGFELPTRERAGTKGELVAEVRGTSAARSFCFEADTR